MILSIQIVGTGLSENDRFCLRDSIKDYEGGLDCSLIELLEDLPGLEEWKVRLVKEVLA